METHKGSLVLLVAAVPGITIFTSLARTIEPIQGLLLHPAFTIPMALASLAILPVLGAHAWSRRAFGVLLGASVMGALGLALVAAQQPPFSEQAPQRLNVLFVDDHATPGAQWALEAAGTLPEAVRAVASCAATPVRPWPSAWSKAYLAPAGAHVFDAPTAQVVSEPEGSGRRLTVTLGGTPDADRLWVVVPKNAGLTTVGFQGQTYTPRASAIDQEGTVIGCMTRDCPGQQVTLQFDSLRPVTLWLGEQQFRLPPQAQPLVHARPSTATPQHVGDATVIGGPLLVP